jgi:hypothetical protein
MAAPGRGSDRFFTSSTELMGSTFKTDPVTFIERPPEYCKTSSTSPWTNTGFVRSGAFDYTHSPIGLNRSSSKRRTTSRVMSGMLAAQQPVFYAKLCAGADVEIVSYPTRFGTKSKWRRP